MSVDEYVSENRDRVGVGRTPGLVSTRRRKYSVPLTANHWQLEPPQLPGSTLPLGRSGSPNRRRFSNVSTVSRKISTTIGWRSIGITEVVNQAKFLCSQYIRSRLKRAGLLHKKLGLQRLRSVSNMQGGWEVCEVFPRVSGIGQELERSHPKVYGSVARQLSITLTSDKVRRGKSVVPQCQKADLAAGIFVTRSCLAAVGMQIFESEVDWGRIISLFAVAAGLASDCVKQGHPEYVAGLVEVMGLVTERHTAMWIATQGGWHAILQWSQAPEAEPSVLEVLVLVVAGLILIAFTIILSFKCIGQLVS